MIIDSPIISGSLLLSGSTSYVGNTSITGSTYISSSNNTQFQVGSNILFVSSSGDIGIKTTTPYASLEIYGADMKMYSSSLYMMYTPQNAGEYYGRLRGGYGSTTLAGNAASIDFIRASTNYGDSGGLSFKTNVGNGSLTERMKIDQNGIVTVSQTLLAGTSTDKSTGNLQSGGAIGLIGTINNLATGEGTYTRTVWYADTSNQILFENGRTTDSASGTGRTVYFTWRGGPSVGGGVQLVHGTNAWAAYSSDARLKTKVADVENGVEAIMKLNPIKFKWTRELENSITVTGFTAQNIEEAIPDAVFNSWQDEELGDVKSYYSDYLVPYLVKAIQELTARVQELENK